MKARITTVISLVGVLGAGSAAALVNTQVLQSTESKSNEQVTVGAAGESATPILTPEAIVVGDPVAESAAVVGVATKIQSNVLTATQSMYQVGDAGLVTLDASGANLSVVSVTPNAGWTLIKAENYSPADIEVKLQSGNTIVEFKAHLELGVITTSVESKIVGDGGTGSTPAGQTPAGLTPGGGTIDDDDDDDSYEDDDDSYEDDDGVEDEADDSDEDSDDDHGDDDD